VDKLLFSSWLIAPSVTVVAELDKLIRDRPLSGTPLKEKVGSFIQLPRDGYRVVPVPVQPIPTVPYQNAFFDSGFRFLKLTVFYRPLVDET